MRVLFQLNFHVLTVFLSIVWRTPNTLQHLIYIIFMPSLCQCKKSNFDSYTSTFFVFIFHIPLFFLYLDIYQEHNSTLYQLIIYERYVSSEYMLIWHHCWRNRKHVRYEVQSIAIWMIRDHSHTFAYGKLALHNQDLWTRGTYNAFQSIFSSIFGFKARVSVVCRNPTSEGIYYLHKT